VSEVAEVAAPAPRTPAANRSLRRLRALPLALWACVAVGLMNGFAWAILTPSFQGPDELVHTGYAQYLAETGRVPRPTGTGLYFYPPPDLLAAVSGVPFSITGNPNWSAGGDRDLKKRLEHHRSRKSEGGAGYAVNNPPLYYALEAVPYLAASGGNSLDQLFAMRVLSVLLGGLTVALVFLFLRELLPRVPWAWTVGALAVAFQPLFGFMTGTVNNDALLWPICAAVFLALARSFRRGLTVKRGAAIGGLVAAGVLTKGSMFGLLPGIGVALLLMIWRAPREQRRRALLAAGVAASVALVPIAGWIVANDALFSRPSSTTSSGFLAQTGEYKWREFVSYLWQSYLPRLPFMTDQFPNAEPGFPGYPDYPLWETYFQGLVGRFGWFQYGFPEWANFVALGIWLAILGFFGRALWVCRKALRRRWPELVTYLAIAAGVLLLVAVAGYRYRIDNHVNFEQTRYLFPLLALYGALVAIVAARGARRLAPALGALLVVLAFGQNVFAAIVTVERYYDSGRLPEYIVPGPRGGQIRVQRAVPPEPAPQPKKTP
jgi:predicted membrane protein DUF2142